MRCGCYTKKSCIQSKKQKKRSSKKNDVLLRVQLNHPGSQKEFKLNCGYKKHEEGNHIIREWNKDGQHYRKFIQNQGEYINNLEEETPQNADLLFWGEWEGCSIFQPLNNPDTRVLPNGVHRPIHSLLGEANQNTDPYIYGDLFKYATCKQKGQMTRLQIGSLILFGSVYPNEDKFYIDTVFVVGDYDFANNIKKPISQIYRELTLDRLYDYYNSDNRLYYGQTWWADRKYFSYVPCKIDGESGFERFYISLTGRLNNEIQFSRNSTGISYLQNCKYSCHELWKRITEKVIGAGFKLGIRFEEPPLYDF